MKIEDMETVEEIVEAHTNRTPAVYLIGNLDFGYCKIGRSKHPWSRVRELDEPKLPFEIEILAIMRVGKHADLWLEKKLHKVFRKRKLRGEWFTGVFAEEFTRKAKKLMRAYQKGER